MTVQQLVEWIDACNEAAVERSKEQAILLHGQAQQIVSGVARLFDKRAKFLDLAALYPAWFGKKEKINTQRMTPDQLQQAQVLCWRTFLGV